MNLNLMIWPPKDPAEKIWLTFNFANALQTGETISSSTVAVSLRSGADADVSQMLDGAATITTDGKVMQKIKGGNNKANYLYKCTAELSSGRVLVLAAGLPVRLVY